jgi:hypothetical protein
MSLPILRKRLFIATLKLVERTTKIAALEVGKPTDKDIAMEAKNVCTQVFVARSKISL